MIATRSILLILFLALLAKPSEAQDPEPRYYVTIGVFGLHDYALRYTERANKMNFSAQYAINRKRKLYYVYLFETDDKKKAWAFMMKIRVETEFKDAWVFIGNLGTESDAVQPVTKPVVVPPVEEKIKEAPKTEPPVEVIKPVVVEEVKPVIEEEKPKVDSIVVVKEEPKKPRPAGKPFLFKLVNEDTGNPVVGEVHIFDGARNEYRAVVGNEVVYLPAPRDPSAMYTIATLAAGYQEMRIPINYADPASSASEVGSEEEYVIALPLVQVKMGDYIEFGNVRFFANSAILQPDSQNELDALATLLNENSKYKVSIHGHCNGTGSRDIVSKGKSTEFFATSTANHRENATDKRLTELRAEIVKEYLMSQGVSGKRIKTKGEGGSSYIYPANSTLASRNDRVEVEVKQGR